MRRTSWWTGPSRRPTTARARPKPGHRLPPTARSTRRQCTTDSALAPWRRSRRESPGRLSTFTSWRSRRPAYRARPRVTTARTTHAVLGSSTPPPGRTPGSSTSGAIALKLLAPRRCRSRSGPIPTGAILAPRRAARGPARAASPSGCVQPQGTTGCADSRRWSRAWQVRTHHPPEDRGGRPGHRRGKCACPACPHSLKRSAPPAPYAKPGDHGARVVAVQRALHVRPQWLLRPSPAGWLTWRQQFHHLLHTGTPLPVMIFRFLVGTPGWSGSSWLIGKGGVSRKPVWPL